MSSQSDDAPVSDLADAAARLRDAKERLAQAESWFEGTSGHEKPEAYEEMTYWTAQTASARTAWRALAGPEALEP